MPFELETPLRVTRSATAARYRGTLDALVKALERVEAASREREAMKQQPAVA